MEILKIVYTETTGHSAERQDIGHAEDTAELVALLHAIQFQEFAMNVLHIWQFT